MSTQTDPHPAPAPPADQTCALLARTHDSQLPGTAPVATGWVLIEQPGAWGRTALTSSSLDPALGASLDAAAGDDVRAVLVRRPSHHTAATPQPRTVVLAHAGPTPWAERLELTTEVELWDLDPSLAAAASPPGLGTPLTAPLWLVCTHGKRDRCCAEHGRPIVDALAARHGEAVWEVSHVGGHRFAGNVVSLPGGEVYGLLDPGAALRAVELQHAGRYDLAHLRGHSGRSRAEQAAELLTRHELGVDGRDAVEVLGSTTQAGARTTEVRLRIDGTDHLVVVRAEDAGVSYLQSCDKDEPADPGRFALVHLTASR